MNALIIYGGSKVETYLSRFTRVLVSYISDALGSGSATTIECESNYDISYLTSIRYKTFDTILFFPCNPSDYSVAANLIKVKNPNTLLVTLLDNPNDDMQMLHKINLALESRSNLFVEVTKKGRLCMASVSDPLGNVFNENTTIMPIIAKTLINRLRQLSGYSRMRSIQTAIDTIADKSSATKFIEAVSCYSETIHAGRDIPFRMIQPSMKIGKDTFFSKRWCRDIDITVPSMMSSDLAGEFVSFYGDQRPSLDTPAHLMLYKKLPWARFIIHSRSYILDAPLVDEVFSCGAVELWHKVMAMHRLLGCSKKARRGKMIRLNLNGNGSIIISEAQEDMFDIPYIERHVPESHYLQVN